MKRLVFVLLILFSITITGFSQIPFTPGWYQIPNSDFQTVCPANNFGGSSYAFFGLCVNVITPWVSGGYDPTHNQMIVWGGGHQDYNGDEVYSLNLSTLTRSRLTDPTLQVGIPTIIDGADTTCYDTLGGSARPADNGPSPNARHTWGQEAYMVNVNKLITWDGGVACGIGGAHFNHVWVFDTTNNTWTLKAPTGDVPDVSSSGGIMAYDPNTGLAFFSDLSYLFSYNLSTNVITKVSTFTPIDYHLTAVVDPKRKHFLAFGCALCGGSGTQAWQWDITSGGSYTRTALTTTGGSAIEGAVSPGLLYDPVRDRVIAWPGGDTIYSLNLDTLVWTPITYTGGPGAEQPNGTWQRWSYDSVDDVYVLVNDMRQNAYAWVPPDRGGGIPSGTKVTSVSITSTTGSADAPYMFAVPFKKGDVPSGHVPTLKVLNAQMVVKSTWSDGSVKLAIGSGDMALAANTPVSIDVQNSTMGPSGTNLTATDIQTAAPSASIQCGGLGTVNLSSLLASPFRTWVSGPEMVEAHYEHQVGSDPNLVAWFEVRLWKSGAMWVRAIVVDGFLDVATVDKSYIPTIIIGGTTVYNNGGSTLTHYAHTRYSAEGYIGVTNPQVTPKHDPVYVMSTKLVPNYWQTNPSATILNSLATTYTQTTGRAGWTQDMGDEGFQMQIGILPEWDALYVTSADSRAYNSVIANALSINNYAIIWPSSSTNLPIKPSDFPTWTLEGAGGGGFDGVNAGSLRWEIAHHGSAGYLAYLITGDYYFYETMLYQNALGYLCITSAKGSGTSRLMQAQTRAAAWLVRSETQLSGIYPAGDTIAADYQSLLSNNIDHYKTVLDGLAGYGTGQLYEQAMDTYFGAGGPIGAIAPWQTNFFIQSLGSGFDVEPLASMTNYTAVRNSWYRFVVGMLGDATGYYYTWAGSYNIYMSMVNSPDPSTWLPNWASVWTNSLIQFGLGFTNMPQGPNTGNTLQCSGCSGSDPSVASTGYWGNMLPAIVYAVDHNAPGAQASFNRITGATNWAALTASANAPIPGGFNDVPIFGLTPRVQAPVTSFVMPLAGPGGLVGSGGLLGAGGLK